MSNTLYDPDFEHDACGVGFLARLSGQPDHELVRMGVLAVSRLEHRGAVAADGKSGDGAGILTGLPRRFFEREAGWLGRTVSAGQLLGVGMVFFPAGDTRGRDALWSAVEAQGLEPIGWRPVPVDPGALGAAARSEMPEIVQILVTASWSDANEFERRLYLARKAFEREGAPGYVCSLSGRTVVYKALCVAHQLDRFFPDLRDPLFESALVLYHQRYSTNTLPSWEMVQPFRLLAHNGEINTLWGNRAWMRVREAEMPTELHPLLPAGGSDSAALDAALELLARNGRDVTQSLSMLVTPAWEETAGEMPPEVRAYYHSHAPLLEPWDGPSALGFTDGRFVGAALDRNGLRPCRYKITSDGLVVAGSEVGVLPIDDDTVIEKGRLGPGQMLLVDLAERRVLHDAEIKRWLATEHATPHWTAVPLPAPGAVEAVPSEADLARLQCLFALDKEEQKYVLPPMVEQGTYATWSMGDDTPIAPLARAPRSLYAFFRQRFAQVTNPPIDPLRERRVMSLRTWLGPRPALLGVSGTTQLYELDSPILSAEQAAAVRASKIVPVGVVTCGMDAVSGDLKAAIHRICTRAEAAVAGGTQILVLTDRDLAAGEAPVPMVLAAGAVHHRLIETGVRTKVGLVIEAGDCWDPHHAAVLTGYGAGAIYPWLALATARTLDPGMGEARVRAALESGLLKIMSKMGISTVGSYRGGQLFEILGLDDEVVELCFTGTPSRISGLGFDALAATVVERYRASGLGDGLDLPDYGRVRYRRGDDSETHAWQPTTVRALQKGVGVARGSKGPDAAAWAEFDRLLEADGPAQLRDLLDLVPAGPAVPLEEVEPAEEIARRFVTSAMSLGALSPEAHQTLTIAMNRLGARSNSGEGGEDPAVYRMPAGGDRLDNKIKQVASGRFGVTAEYLAHAEELEIKIAQGSKPGEGGQLPGHKVTELIARLRHSQPGISLISPPPHHDIYSIEDLAQLIHDLRTINPRARVGVKLVSEAGVGTIAAGVAKAYADYVVVSGHAGGTGASPLSSIKHAGAPWELGLSEAQQVLVRNGLRGRVRVRTDGGVKNGRDVMIAVLLGADEVGFGTAPLVSMGCDMARQCHLNTCPAGIATQREDLRAKFRGTPEGVIRYFLNVAEEVRALLALLGLRKLEDAVGRVDLLRQAREAAGIRLNRVLAGPPAGAVVRYSGERGLPAGAEKTTLEWRLLEDVRPAIEGRQTFVGEYAVENHDRTVGAGLSGEIAARWGAEGLPDGSVRLTFTGSAGQSFGAFAAPGLQLVVHGEVNDYVGKGLSGGEIVLRPKGYVAAEPHEHVIAGNVILYGATSGRLFAAGRAGERFAIRNSGATAVVEGVGDHGCEYMTGGTVVVLGETGWNFGAGMTGGEAFVLDPAGEFPARVNGGTVRVERADGAALGRLRQLVALHLEKTGSPLAQRLLESWGTAGADFWRVAPHPASVPEVVETEPAAAASDDTRAPGVIPPSPV